MATGRALRFFVETFGCQMNVNDSEKVAGLLTANGYEATDSPETADLVFVNTCAVREKAAEKLFHTTARWNHLRKRRPGLRIGVGGCVSQLHGDDILRRLPQIDFLVGPRNIARIPEFVERVMAGERGLVDLNRGADAFDIPHGLVARGSRVSAYVTVMEGCNQVCSFCVVPKTRGTETNRPADRIVAEVQALVDGGYSEVVLLGQTVNGYRCDGVEFPDLLARVDAVSGLKRLRFTTSHPSHVSEAMARSFVRLERLCPYLHLPCQSGADRVLGSMRRGYDRDGYLRVIEMLRSLRPDLALTTDVIVGYPGESDSEFQDTLALIEMVGFEGIFAFTYSPRPGTGASRLADDVPEAEKGDRLRLVNDFQQRRQEAANAARIGTREKVLLDSLSGAGRLSGRTPHFRIVHLDGPVSLLGREVDVLIEGAGPNSMRGRLWTQPSH